MSHPKTMDEVFLDAKQWLQNKKKDTKEGLQEWIQFTMDAALRERSIITNQSLVIYVHTKEDLKQIAAQQSLRFLDFKLLKNYVVHKAEPAVKPWREFPPSSEETHFLKHIEPSGEEWSKRRKPQQGCSNIDILFNKGHVTIQEQWQLDTGLVAPRDREEQECVALARGHFHEDENRKIALAVTKAEAVTCPAIWIHQTHFRLHCSPDGVLFYNKNIHFNVHFLDDHQVALVEIKQPVVRAHELSEKEIEALKKKLSQQFCCPLDQVINIPPNWCPPGYVIQQQGQMETARTQTDEGLSQIGHSMFSSSCRFDHLNMPVYDPKTGRFLINRYFSSRVYYNKGFCQEIKRRQEMYYQCCKLKMEPRSEDFEWTDEEDEKYPFKFVPEFYIEFWLRPALDAEGKPRITKDEKTGQILPCMKRKKDGTPVELIGTVEVDKVVNWQAIPQFITLNQFAKSRAWSYSLGKTFWWMGNN